MIEALTLRGLEDRIRAEIMIDALTLRGLEDGIRPKIMIAALTLLLGGSRNFGPRIARDLIFVSIPRFMGMRN